MDSESRSISFETITNAEEFSIKFMALKKGLRIKTGEIEAKDALIRQLQAENVSLKKELESCRVKCKETSKSNERHVTKVKALLEQFEIASQKHEEIVEHLKNETLMDCRHELSKKDNEIKTLRDDLDMKNQRMTKDIESKDQTIAGLTCHLKQQKITFLGCLQRANGEIFQNRSYITKLHNDIGYYQHLLDNAQKNLAADITTMMQDQVKKQCELNETKKANSELSNSLEKAKSEIALLQAEQPLRNSMDTSLNVTKDLIAQRVRKLSEINR